MAESPTSRSLKALRNDGWHVGVVERYIAQCRQKFDFLGCIDLIGVKGLITLGVQATSGSNVSARIKKALPLPGLRAWLDAGNRFEVWGWRKIGGRGKKKVWKVRIVKITLEDLPK